MTRPALATLVALIGAVACTTTPPYETPFEARRVTPEGGQLAVNQLVVLFDSSGSIDPQTIFPGEKATLESFVSGMPDGSYDVDLISFGGKTRDESGLSSFDRAKLTTDARDVKFIGEDTPLASVLNETADKLAGRSGTAAVVIVTDGLPTVRGVGTSGDATVEAAQEVVKRHDGPVCFHTVQVGSNPMGAALLEQIAGLTDCGSFRNSDQIDGTAPLYAFEREIFLGSALPAVAAPPPAGLADADGDGVPDANDLCAHTPRGAKTDSTGCWKVGPIRFALESSAVPSADTAEIQRVASVMRANPDVKLQIGGYTDTTGPSEYNQVLSQRRAEAARQILIDDGVPANRIVAQGYGEADPIAPNDTRAGREQNRRVEFKIER